MEIVVPILVALVLGLALFTPGNQSKEAIDCSIAIVRARRAIELNAQIEPKELEAIRGVITQCERNPEAEVVLPEQVEQHPDRQDQEEAHPSDGQI